jgi:hypothetical protein
MSFIHAKNARPCRPQYEFRKHNGCTPQGIMTQHFVNDATTRHQLPPLRANARDEAARAVIVQGALLAPTLALPRKSLAPQHNRRKLSGLGS